MEVANQNKAGFPWKKLDDSDNIGELVHSNKTVLFFKHSTRCNISATALKFFEREFEPTSEISCYFLDLIRYRELSDQIEKLTGVQHQSPQVIVLKNGQVSYQASHHHIDASQIMQIN